MAKVRLLQLSALAAVLALWALIAAVGVVSSTALPGPRAVAAAFGDLVGSGGFWQAVGETLRGAVTGLLVAVGVGIPVGLLTGVHAAAEESSRLLMEILRSFPVIALMPVFLLVLGSTPGMKATVVFVACVFPVLLQAQYGGRSVSQAVRETVHGFRIPRLLRLRRVVLPAAAPSIMTGLRLAATTSVLVAIGVEVLTTLPGIGHMVMESQQAGASAKAYAYILTAGAIGYSITQLAQFAEHRLLRWRPPARSGKE